MTGIVVTGGKRPAFSLVRSLFEKADYIVAADSGLDYCMREGITPDYILGDMDSLKNHGHLEGFPAGIVERHSPEKDYTDTELGLLHLYEKQPDRSILIGGGGGRPDHFLAIFSLYYGEKKPDIWISHNSIFTLIRKSFTFSALPEENLSFFPLSPSCLMSSRGLHWPLDKLKWGIGDCGVSNRACADELSIIMHSGELLMIRELSEKTLPN